ncbi:MAG: hypothetical protein M4579_006838, partial [Chaenotheca gracillima]
LKIADIIPDVIDDFQPSILVQIAYPASHESASLGNYIDPKDVQTKPTVLLQADPDSEVAEDTLFTVIMTDPDAPSRQDPKWSEMCHWIATNITLLPSANSSPHPDADLPSRSLRPAPAELIEYYPPGPPPKTGPHRYVFLVFKPRNGTTSHLSPPPDRKRWGYGKVRHGVRKWATENDLIPVGERSAVPEFDTPLYFWHMLTKV